MQNHNTLQNNKNILQTVVEETIPCGRNYLNCKFENRFAANTKVSSAVSSALIIIINSRMGYLG